MSVYKKIQTHQLSSQGFSLVELLVGMAISLLVGSVAIGYLISSSQLHTAKSSQDLIQENNRFAFDMVSNFLLHAGLVNTSQVDNNIYNALFFRNNICSAQLKDNVTAVGTTVCNRNNQNNVVGPAGSTVTYSSDRLAIQTITDQTFESCSGQTITFAAGAPAQNIVTVFWAGDIDADGVSSLYCQTYSATLSITGAFDTFQTLGTPVPIVDGIQMFQYQLGIDNDGDNDVDLYQDYDNVAASNRVNVKTIRIGFLTSSGQAIQGNSNTEEAQTKTYNLFDGTHTTAATDREQRLTSSFTVFLPNESI